MNISEEINRIQSLIGITKSTALTEQVAEAAQVFTRAINRLIGVAEKTTLNVRSYDADAVVKSLTKVGNNTAKEFDQELSRAFITQAIAKSPSLLKLISADLLSGIGKITNPMVKTQLKDEVLLKFSALMEPSDYVILKNGIDATLRTATRSAVKSFAKTIENNKTVPPFDELFSSGIVTKYKILERITQRQAEIEKTLVGKSDEEISQYAISLLNELLGTLDKSTISLVDKNTFGSFVSNSLKAIVNNPKKSLTIAAIVIILISIIYPQSHAARKTVRAVGNTGIDVLKGGAEAIGDAFPSGGAEKKVAPVEKKPAPATKKGWANN